MRALLLPAMGLALLLSVPTSALAQSAGTSGLPPALRAAIASCSATSAAECERLIRQVVQVLSANNPALRDQLFIGALQGLQATLPPNSPVLVQVAGNILPDIAPENRGTVQALVTPQNSFFVPPPPVS